MVRLGFALVYLGFAYALAAAWFAIGSLFGGGGTISWPARVGTAAGGVLVLLGLTLPSVDGFPEGALSGWEALDPWSTGAAAVLVALLVAHALRGSAGGPTKAATTAGLAASLAGLVLGNAVIQSSTDRGTEPAPGLWVSTAGAVVALGAALAELWRGGDRP